MVSEAFTYEDEVAPGTYYPVTSLIYPNVAVQQAEGLADPKFSTVRTTSLLC